VITLSNLDGPAQLPFRLVVLPALTLAALIVPLLAVAHMALSTLIIELIALATLATLVVLLLAVHALLVALAILLGLLITPWLITPRLIAFWLIALWLIALLISVLTALRVFLLNLILVHEESPVCGERLERVALRPLGYARRVPRSQPRPLRAKRPHGRGIRTSNPRSCHRPETLTGKD
jgi:hypothetical protein